MIALLHLTLLVDEALLLIASVALTVRPRGTGWLFPGAVALQVLLVVQAVVGLVNVAGPTSADHSLPRPGLFAAYLVASVALLPVAGALVGRTDVRLAAARLGAGSAMAIVLQLRLAGIWAERVH